MSSVPAVSGSTSQLSAHEEPHAHDQSRSNQPVCCHIALAHGRIKTQYLIAMDVSVNHGTCLHALIQPVWRSRDHVAAHN